MFTGEAPMKRLAFVLLIIVVEVAFGSLQAGAGTDSNSQLRRSLIVSTEWLAKHLKDDSLVLLQVGEKEEYAAAHIARYPAYRVGDDVYLHFP